MVRPHDIVVDLKDIDLEDEHYVGARAAILGSLSKKISVPQGFVIAYPSYYEFLKHNNLDLKIKHLLGATNFELPESIGQIAQHVRSIIKNSVIPEKIVKDIMSSYEKLSSPKVLMQTVIVSGDNKQEDYERSHKNYEVNGDSSLLDAIRSSWSSIFTPALMVHRHMNHIDHLKTSISAFVTKFPTSSISGKIFTKDPYSLNNSKAIIDIDSDYYEIIVDKNNLTFRGRAKNAISRPHVLIQDFKAAKKGIDNNQILDLAKLALALEKHFFFPQVADWVIENGKILVVNSKNIN